jgi:hypothetical protein
MSGWIGVDFDGTLAIDDAPSGDYDPARLGDPVPAMAARVREWLALGIEVRVFTARAAVPADAELVAAWTEKHFGVRLLVTNIKDRHMWMLWDDRAVACEKNTGRYAAYAKLFQRRPKDTKHWAPNLETL